MNPSKIGRLQCYLKTFDRQSVSGDEFIKKEPTKPTEWTIESRKVRKRLWRPYIGYGFLNLLFGHDRKNHQMIITSFSSMI
jgi:hypothetical protein